MAYYWRRQMHSLHVRRLFRGHTLFGDTLHDVRPVKGAFKPRSILATAILSANNAGRSRRSIVNVYGMYANTSRQVECSWKI